MNKKKYKSPYHKELAIIHAGAKALGLDRDLLHKLLENLTGKRSFTKTTALDRAKMINDLKSKGAFRFHRGKAPRRQDAVPKAPRDHAQDKTEDKVSRERPGGKGTDMITAKQQAFIEELWLALAELVENASSNEWRGAFIHRIIGRPWPQKKWEANRLIEALKARIKQEHAAAQPHSGEVPSA